MDKLTQATEELHKLESEMCSLEYGSKQWETKKNRIMFLRGYVAALRGEEF